MWKYVSRRVKDTIELGINVRKSFTVQQTLNNNPSADQQQQNERKQNQHHLNWNVVPRYQDPSRDQDKKDEKFKRKYHRLNQNQRCFLNALTWSTAIITGFYSSQLLCLYRRNQRLAFDGSRCCYSKYLLNTTKQIHRNVQYLLTPAGQHSILSSLPKLECPFKKTRSSEAPKTTLRTIEDEFSDFKHFVDPGYKQYERFFEGSNNHTSTNSANLYNVNNDTKNQLKVDHKTEDLKTESANKESTEDRDIDSAIRQLAHIVGELEFQMGLESVIAGDYDGAAEHFKLSTHHKHPGGIFNLALCFEQGLGVRRNMKTAKRLYEIACELGHARAHYNLGVFYAQGLGGTNKSFNQAKQCFEQAAKLGDVNASEALSLLRPPQKKLPIIEEIPEDEFFYKEPVISKRVSLMDNQSMRRIAVI